MNNKERLSIVRKIKNDLNPLSGEHFRKQLMLNFLVNKRRTIESDDDDQEIINLENELKNLNEQIEPLLIKLKNIQTVYEITIQYDEFVNRIRTVRTEQKWIPLASDVDIDLSQNKIDFTNDDVKQLLSEIEEFLYATYGQFSVIGLKRK